MNRSSERGFTIIETIVSMTIFLITLVAVLTVYDSARRIYTRGDRKVDLQMNARLALAQMSRQIRMAGYFPENLTAVTPLTDSIRIATDNAVAIYGDTDNTGASSVALFCLDGTNLRLSRGAVTAASSYTCTAGDIIASKVSSLKFAYYDVDNNPLPDPPTGSYQLDSQSPGGVPSMVTATTRRLVRRVVVTLTASTAGLPGQGTQTYTLVSDIWRRNEG